MEEDQPGRVPQQRLLEKGPWLHRRPIQSSAKDLTLAQQPIPRIEEERPHHLLIPHQVAESQVVRYRSRVGQRPPLGQPSPCEPSCQLDRGQDGRRLRGAETFATQSTGAQTEEPGRSPAASEEAPSQLDRRNTRPTGAQQDGDQLPVGESLAAVAEQALARLLLYGKILDATR